MSAAETPVLNRSKAPVDPVAPARASLVMLPGTLCDRRLFAPMLRRLTARETVVPGLTGHATMESLAERVLQEAPPCFALLGFSLGGILALEVIARAPSRVLGLALVSTTGRRAATDTHAARRKAARDAAARGVDAWTAEELWPRSVGPAARRDPTLRAVAASMAREQGGSALLEQTEAVLSRADSLARLSTISVPTLVVGGAQDPTCTPAMHAEIAAGVPGARLELLSGIGHFVPLEAPNRLAELVQAWLDEVDSLAATGHTQDSARGSR